MTAEKKNRERTKKMKLRMREQGSMKGLGKKKDEVEYHPVN